MAKLKVVKLKEKEYVFNAYGNADDSRPAKVVFSRFPAYGETFTPTGVKDIFDGVDLEKANTAELRKTLTEKIVETFTENMINGRTDYRLFFKECVDCFRDFEYGNSTIVTANDFWQILPPEAAHTIAKEAFSYANKKDEFTMGELKA